MVTMALGFTVSPSVGTLLTATFASIVSEDNVPDVVSTNPFPFMVNIRTKFVIVPADLMNDPPQVNVASTFPVKTDPVPLCVYEVQVMLPPVPVCAIVVFVPLVIGPVVSVLVDVFQVHPEMLNAPVTTIG